MLCTFANGGHVFALVCLLDFTLLKVLLTDFAGQIGMITVDEIRERVPKYYLHPGVLGNIRYQFAR